MDETPQQPVTLAQVARIGIDVPCISCGYNLRSLPMSGRCPECNSEIDATLNGGWLMFADPQWLKRLRSGVTLILWTLLAAVVSYIVLAMCMVVFFMPSGGPPDLGGMGVLMVAMGFGLWTAWLISVVWLTAPEPGDRAHGGARRRTLAKWIIALTVAPGLSMLISGLSYDTMMTSPEFPLFDGWLLSKLILGYVASFAGTVGFFLLLILMRRIARRHTSKGLGKLMTTLIWGAVGLGAGWIIAAAALVGFSLYVVSTGAMGTTTTSAPAGLAALGYASPPTTTGPGSVSSRIGLNTPPTSISISSPRATPGAATTGPAVATTGSVTSRPTSGPATTMPAMPPLPPFMRGRWMFLGLFLMVILEFGSFGWGICGIVALFWFRSAFGHALAQNATHPMATVVRQ